MPDGEYPKGFEAGMQAAIRKHRREERLTQGDRALDERARREGYFNRERKA